MKHAILTITASLALSACVDISDPAMVSDYNGRVVKIIDHGGYYPLNTQGLDVKDSAAYKLAVETCALDGRKDAKYQGVRIVAEATGEHTFLCI